MGANTGERVDTSPTKSFFVSMHTRDIKLEDAVLDLLDNCVDGINRSGKKNGAKPYDGFTADIKFDATSFTITDNCGGIPWDQRNYAFRMGRPSEANRVSGSVGVYGIGMKRAIFKLGGRCTISTRNGNDRYGIEITPQWLRDEKTWDIGVSRPVEWDGDAGTRIEVSALHEGISKMLGEDGASFGSRLAKTISTHYAYIMDKGFRVTINGEAIKPKTISILYGGDKRADSAINPFVYEDEVDGVRVYLAVGLNDNIPSNAEIDRELEAPTRSSEDAGWTVLCNDRVVLYCDRTELTGWGEAGVPRYHTQFIAISGVVEFRSDDPSKLPTTTTKRGLDASSKLYLQVKNKMREGMKVFTNYTNRWKSKAGESKKHTDRCAPLPLNKLRGETKLRLRKVPDAQNARQHKPRLPSPAKPQSSTELIEFRKDKKKIREVAEYLRQPGLDPSDVGSRCFDLIHDETGK